MRPRLSVVIPSYNSAATVGRTIASLRASLRVGRVAEVIVVDSSTDGRTPALLAAEAHGGVRVERAGERVMPALARNLGARLATGDALAFLDADAYAEPDWADRVLDALRSGCRAGGGAVLPPPSQRGKPIALAQFFLQFNEFMPAGRARPKPFTPSCNLFCERTLFFEAGGFPAVRASEDVLFGKAVSRRVPFWFVPAARVRHVFRECPAAFLRNQALLGEHVLYQRRFERARSPLLTGALPALSAPVVAAAKGARIAWRVARLRPDLVPALLSCMPFFLPGLAAWGFGFARGALRAATAAPTVPTPEPERVPAA